MAKRQKMSEKLHKFSIPYPNMDTDPFLLRCNRTFMTYFHNIKSDDPGFKTYCAIHMTAEALNNSAENISRMLVEIGLRAPIEAFPKSFTSYIQDKKSKAKWDRSGTTSAQKELAHIWQQPDENWHFKNYDTAIKSQTKQTIPRQKSLHPKF